MLNHGMLGTILIPAWQRGRREGEGRGDSIPQASEGTTSPLLVALGLVPPHATHSISLCVVPSGQQDLVLAVQQLQQGWEWEENRLKR